MKYLTVLPILALSCANSSQTGSQAEPTKTLSSAPTQSGDISGRYRIKSDGPFYVSQGASMPANPQEKTDEMTDCSLHASVNTVVAIDDGKVTLVDDEGKLDTFTKVAKSEINGCKVVVKLAPREAPMWLAGGEFRLNLCGTPSGIGKDVYFEIFLDGTAGENQFTCFAQSAPLTVDKLP